MPKNYSTFNPENNWQIDEFVELSDYTADDISNIERYQALKKKSNLTVAESEELLALSNGLKNKMLTSLRINTYEQGLIFLQEYFKENTLGLLESHKTNMDEKIALAEEEILNYIARLNGNYDYDETITYLSLMPLFYTNNGITDLYICKKDCPMAGVLPTNTEYFIKVTQRGKQGEPGANFVWRYGWQESVNYDSQALVNYNQKMYLSLQDNNLGHSPEEENSRWWLFWQYQVPNQSIGMEQISQSAIDELTSVKNTGLLGGSYKLVVNADSGAEKIYLQRFK